MNGLYSICSRCGFHSDLHIYPEYKCPTDKECWIEYFKEQEYKKSFYVNSLLPKRWIGVIAILVVFILMLIFLLLKG